MDPECDRVEGGEPAAGDGPESALTRLVRAIGRRAYADADRAYKALFAVGPQMIPLAQAVLYEADWKELRRGAGVDILSTLLNLIHDLDETKSRETAVALIARGCHRAYRTRIDTVLRFASDNFLRYVVRGIEVHESKDLPPTRRRAGKLDSWLGNVPLSDLAHLKRIYLVPYDRSYDYAGLYYPNLYKITLVWDATSVLLGRRVPVLLLSPLESLLLEKTLYHEIGHHVHRHQRGWRDPEKEAEADAYAYKALRAAHPMLRRVGRMIRFIRGREAVRRRDPRESRPE